METNTSPAVFYMNFMNIQASSHEHIAICNFYTNVVGAKS